METYGLTEATVVDLELIVALARGTPNERRKTASADEKLKALAKFAELFDDLVAQADIVMGQSEELDDDGFALMLALQEMHARFGDVVQGLSETISARAPKAKPRKETDYAVLLVRHVHRVMLPYRWSFTSTEDGDFVSLCAEILRHAGVDCNAQHAVRLYLASIRQSG